MNNFPFKTLIWAFVVVIALFLFRSAWEHLIFNVKKFVLFDKVEVEMSESDYDKIADLVTDYELKIESLEHNADLLTQNSDALEGQIAKFKSEAAQCEEAQKIAEIASSQSAMIEQLNSQIKRDAMSIKDAHVIHPKLNVAFSPLNN